jgi:mono/diheme cytochrome c family protein
LGGGVLLSLLLAAVLAGAVRAVEPEQLRRGLVAAGSDASRPPLTVHTIEPLVALNLQTGEAFHPRLRPDGGIVWKGYLHIREAGEHIFAATLRGTLELRIAGKVVLSATVKDAATALVSSRGVKLPAGVHPFEARFTRLAGAARVELFWQGPGFRREPLPFDVLGHLPAELPAALARDRLADSGRLLVEEAACVRCHTPSEKGTVSKTLASRQGPDLTKVGGRIFAGYLERWLESPSRLRPGTAMPEMFAPEEKAERHAVARYLSTLGGPLAAGATKPDKGDAKRGEQLFDRVGCFACHGPAGKAPQARSASEGIRILPLLGLGSKTTRKHLSDFLRHPLALNDTSRMPSLLLDAREADDLAAFLLRDRIDGVKPTLPAEPPAAGRLAAFKRVETRPNEIKEFEKLSPGKQWLELGKRLVLERSCNGCHTIEPDGKPFATVLPGIDLEDLSRPEKHSRGCLAEKPARFSKSPRYLFTPSQRAAVQAFLTHGLTGAGSRAPLDAARLALERFNCLACHASNGEGGLSAQRIEALRRKEKAEYAETVTPPALTGVGHKLRTPWLKAVLVEAGRARPWMPLRMPQFGPANVGRLPEALARLEGSEPDDTLHTVKLDAAAMTAGRLLVGKSALACVSCHDPAGKANTGARGPDLAGMSKRVRYEWYRRWLEQPQRISPGTRMPTVFTDGRSPLPKVLGGNADAQAEAMWGYLSARR